MYEEMFHVKKNFYLPRRIMDPYSIFVKNLPTDVTNRQIEAAFW